MKKSKTHIFQFPLILGFILLLTLPAINSVMGIWEFDRVSENRTFKDSLSIDINHLDNFPEEANSYLNDNFSFRTPLLDLFHQMKYYVFHTSPHPDKLLVGKNDWYFTAGRELDNYLGKNNFDEDTLGLLINEWKRRKDYFDKQGIKVYWMIAPTAHHVYSNQLPFYIQPIRERRISQLSRAFEEQFPNLILDPLPTLLKNKKEGNLYYQQDNHWNYRAGLHASEYFLDQVRRDFANEYIPRINTVEWKDSLVFDGIHHKVLGIKTNGEIRETPVISQGRAKEVAKYNFAPIENFPYPWEFERRFKSDRPPNTLTIVVIRDSFGEHIMPFVSECFGESVFIFDAWRFQLNEDIIETIEPDIVLYLSLESNVEHFVFSF
jgi:alginate O-acetyltransferase complex protein AlgJ